VTAAIRSPLSVTYAVWRALFLREAVFRLSARRAAWLWLLLEPVFHVAFITLFFELVRARLTPGSDPGMFIMVGLLAFFMLRNTALRSMEAINANSALFAYRQVKPVDTVIVRAALEGFLGLIVALIMLGGAALFGIEVTPIHPLEVMLAFTGLWVAGLGLGLMLSVAGQLVREVGDVVRLLFLPLYFVSGVMFPIEFVPQPYREWLFYNPIVHGVEIMRGGFFPHYHVVREADLSFLLGFAVLTVFMGLALQVRYARKMIAQ
jgi:capsular polysaccharide transport system permease protein